MPFNLTKGPKGKGPEAKGFGGKGFGGKPSDKNLDKNKAKVEKSSAHAGEALRCIFYIINTLVAVMSAFISMCGVVVFFSGVGFSGADSSEAVTGLHLLIVDGAKIFGIDAMAVGLLHFLGSLLGCCGMMNNSLGCLKVVVIWGLAVTFGNITLVCYIAYYFYQVQFTDSFQNELIDTVKRYDGNDNFNTFFLDYVQVKLGCCGVLDKDEYKASPWYKPGQNIVPRSCCQLKSRELVDEFEYSKMTLTDHDLIDSACSDGVNGKSFTTVPCFNLIKDVANSVYSIAVAACVFSMILEGIVAYIAFHKVKKEGPPKPPKPPNVAKKDSKKDLKKKDSKKDLKKKDSLSKASISSMSRMSTASASASRL